MRFFPTSGWMTSRRIGRIAICGGGIGGLTAAAFINQHSDMQVDIYETKPELSAIIGDGIAIWKRSWQVLQDLKLEEEVKKRNISLPQDGAVHGPVFRKADQPEGGFDFHNHMMPYGPISLTRPVLLGLLHSRLSDKSHIHTSKRLINYEVEPSRSIQLFFADGTRASCDVLVGADGVHSPTRASLYKALAAEAGPGSPVDYQKYIEPIWSGTYAYRCFVRLDKFENICPGHQALSKPKIWCGKDTHAVSHPLGGKIGLACFSTVASGEGTPYEGPWVKDVSKQEVLDFYASWEPDLLQLLQHLENPSRWAIHVVHPLPFSVSGRVALLGDAAHAMLPHQGVGGGQSIEDAHILGRLLSHPSTNLGNIEQVLEIYQSIRLPQGSKAAQRSKDNGLMYDFCHPDFPTHATSAEELKGLGEAIGKSFEWLVQGGCDQDWKEAETRLLQLGVST
ncbi:FAD/NAD(P)-binding domain-containing protein [Infundibulicybe gibba]|nr:FAD/NAD(P)-binding domain-containing protein [Infundibulicybe gibba]